MATVPWTESPLTCTAIQAPEHNNPLSQYYSYIAVSDEALHSHWVDMRDCTIEWGFPRPAQTFELSSLQGPQSIKKQPN